MLPSHILKLSEEKKVEPKTIRSYTTIIHYFKTNPNYSQYFLKSKAETSFFPMLNIRLRPSHHNLFHLAEIILNKKFMPGSEEEGLNSILCNAVEGTHSKLANLIGTNWPDLDYKMVDLIKDNKFQIFTYFSFFS